MPQVKYKIYRLSARAIIGYGKEQADGYYSFELNRRETSKCILSGVQEQDDNALFYQIMDELHGGIVFSSDDMIIQYLANVIVYTNPVKYKANSRGDTSFLGRFTFESLLNFEGMVRILTSIARGYMHKTDTPNIEGARQALCAWCSIPDSKNATPKEAWQSKSYFRELHEAYPELVDENGGGWFYRHVHRVAEFVLQNPDAVRKGYAEQAESIQSKFDKMWRDKVVQFQVPIFTLTTKGAWTLRFDDILADAMEQGPLQNYEIDLPEEVEQKVLALVGKKTAPYVCDLIRYYLAHKQDDTYWVVLPVTNFDMYYGNSYFSKRVLSTIPETILVRQNRGPVCRYVVAPTFLPCIHLSDRNRKAIR